MPLLHYEYEGTMFQDGAGSHKYLMDVSEGLSKHYGKLIRQGQIFRIRSIRARIFNPNTAVQDVVMSVSGNYIFMEPTKFRKEAWKEAFRTVQRNRKLLGTRNDKSILEGYDFRVGLHPDYSTDVGAWGEGVKYNAWVNSDAEPLHLSGGSPQGIFDVWNSQIMQANSPVNPGEGFGTWIATNSGALGDELDFVTNENGYYVPDTASIDYNWAPFQVAFSSIYDSAGDAQDSIGTVTNTDVLTGPIHTMCGLIGINVDTTGSDDTISQTQDYGLQVVVDIESWTPIFKRKKNARRKRKK